MIASFSHASGWWMIQNCTYRKTFPPRADSLRVGRCHVRSRPPDSTAAGPASQHRRCATSPGSSPLADCPALRRPLCSDLQVCVWERERTRTGFQLYGIVIRKLRMLWEMKCGERGVVKEGTFTYAGTCFQSQRAPFPGDMPWSRVGAHNQRKCGRIALPNRYGMAGGRWWRSQNLRCAHHL